MRREKKEIVVVGFGFGALELIFMLANALFMMERLTIVAPKMRFVFIPNSIFVPFGLKWKSITVDLCPVMWFLGIRTIKEKVTYVRDHYVMTETGRTLRYDKVVVATGARVAPELIPGLKEHGCIIGTENGSIKMYARLRALAGASKGTDGEGRNIILLNPGGNGCSGPIYEMAFMIRHWCNKHGLYKAKVKIVTSEHALIQTFGSDVHYYCDKMLKDRNIEYRLDVEVGEVNDHCVYVLNSCRFEYDVLVSLAPQRGHNLGLPVDANGFIQVDPNTLGIVGMPNAYAVGDCNNIPLNQGYMAMLQADVVAENIISILRGKAPKKNFGDTMEAMCIMYMGHIAFAGRIPLRLNDSWELEIDESRAGSRYYLGLGKFLKVCKHLIGFSIKTCFTFGLAYHGGIMWKVVFGPALEVLLKVFAKKMR